MTKKYYAFHNDISQDYPLKIDETDTTDDEIGIYRFAEIRQDIKWMVQVYRRALEIAKLMENLIDQYLNEHEKT